MNISPDLRIQSAIVRYSHAQRHLELLNEIWLQADSSDNYELIDIPEYNEKKIIRFKKYPSTYLSLVLGDVIHSWRSSLDYLACALVSSSNPDADLNKIYFPFGRKEQRLNHNEKKSISGINDELYEIIEILRNEHCDLLSILCDISNQDKHRLLVPAYTTLSYYKFVVDERLKDATLISVQPKNTGNEKITLCDGDYIDFSSGYLSGIKVEFKIEKSGLLFGKKEINGINRIIHLIINTLSDALNSK